MSANERSHPTQPAQAALEHLGSCQDCQQPLVRTKIISEHHPDKGKTFAACPTHGAKYEVIEVPDD